MLRTVILKGTVSQDLFASGFLHESSPPQAPEKNIRVILNFFGEFFAEIFQVKVHHRYQQHRQQICHCYLWDRRNRWQIAIGVHDTGGKFANETGGK
jgi:hypothetical protein